MKLSESLNHAELSPTSAGACIHIVVSSFHAVRVKVCEFHRLPSRTLGSASEQGLCFLLLLLSFYKAQLTSYFPPSAILAFPCSTAPLFQDHNEQGLYPLASNALSHSLPLCPMLLFCVSFSASSVLTPINHCSTLSLLATNNPLLPRGWKVQ